MPVPSGGSPPEGTASATRQAARAVGSLSPPMLDAALVFLQVKDETMNFQKFTIKSQEAVQNAQEIASSYNNQSIEPEHLLAALIQDSEGIVVPMLQKLGANVNYLKIKINEAVEKLPKVQGAGLGNQQLSPALGRIFETAQKEAQQLKDEYVSTEHLLLGLIDESGSAGGSSASRLLRDQGLTKDGVYRALKD